MAQQNNVITNALSWTDQVLSLSNRIKRGVINNTKDFRDPLLFLQACQDPFTLTCFDFLQMHPNVKIFASLACEFLIEIRTPSQNVRVENQKIFLSSASKILRRDDSIGEWYILNIADVINT